MIDNNNLTTPEERSIRFYGWFLGFLTGTGFGVILGFVLSKHPL